MHALRSRRGAELIASQGEEMAEQGCTDARWGGARDRVALEEHLYAVAEVDSLTGGQAQNPAGVQESGCLPSERPFLLSPPPPFICHGRIISGPCWCFRYLESSRRVLRSSIHSTSRCPSSTTQCVDFERVASLRAAVRIPSFH